MPMNAKDRAWFAALLAVLIIALSLMGCTRFQDPHLALSHTVTTQPSEKYKPRGKSLFESILGADLKDIDLSTLTFGILGEKAIDAVESHQTTGVRQSFPVPKGGTIHSKTTIHTDGKVEIETRTEAPPNAKE